MEFYAFLDESDNEEEEKLPVVKPKKKWKEIILQFFRLN